MNTFPTTPHTTPNNPKPTSSRATLSRAATSTQLASPRAGGGSGGGSGLGMMPPSEPELSAEEHASLFQDILSAETARVMHGPAGWLRRTATARASLQKRIDQEEERLDALKSGMIRVQECTRAALDVFKELEGRFGAIEKTLLPVKRKTAQELHVRECIDASLARLREVIRYLDTPEEQARLLMGGVQLGGLSNYLDALDAVRDSIEYMNRNAAYNATKSVLPEAIKLSQTGISAIQGLYGRLLAEISRRPYAARPPLPLPPDLGVLPEPTLAAMEAIVERLDKAKEDGYEKGYKETRGNLLRISLSPWMMDKDRSKTTTAGSYAPHSTSVDSYLYNLSAADPLASLSDRPLSSSRAPFPASSFGSLPSFSTAPHSVVGPTAAPGVGANASIGPSVSTITHSTAVNTVKSPSATLAAASAAAAAAAAAAGEEPAIGDGSSASGTAAGGSSMLSLPRGHAESDFETNVRIWMNGGYRRSGRYEQGSHPYIFVVHYFLNVAQHEKALALRVVSLRQSRAVYADVISPMLAAFVKTGELFFKRLKKKLDKAGEDEDTIFELYDIVDTMKAVWADLQRALLHDNSLLAPLTELFENMKKLAQKSFDDFKETRRKAAKQVNANGGVLEHAANTLNYLKRLFEYQSTVESLMLNSKSPPTTGAGPSSTTTRLDASSPSGSQNSPGLDGGSSGIGDGASLGGSSAASPGTATDASVSLAVYITEVLELLLTNLDMWSKSIKSPAVSALFLINNLSYVAKTVRGSHLASKVPEDFLPRLDGSIAAQTEAYIEATWSKPLAKLQKNISKFSAAGGSSASGAGSDAASPAGPGGTPRADGQQLTSSEKSATKNGFNGFNADLEDLAKTQAKLAVPDPELRERIHADILRAVLPVYRRFLTLSRADFSVTVARKKYVKYDSEDVGEKVRSFFSEAV